MGRQRSPDKTAGSGEDSHKDGSFPVNAAGLLVLPDTGGCGGEYYCQGSGKGHLDSQVGAQAVGSVKPVLNRRQNNTTADTQQSADKADGQAGSQQNNDLYDWHW